MFLTASFGIISRNVPHSTIYVFQARSTETSKAGRPTIVKKTQSRQCFKCQSYFRSPTALAKHNPGCVYCPKCFRFRDYRHPPTCNGPPKYLGQRVYCTLCCKSISENRIARHMATAHFHKGRWVTKDHPEVITMVINRFIQSYR